MKVRTTDETKKDKGTEEGTGVGLPSPQITILILLFISSSTSETENFVVEHIASAELLGCGKAGIFGMGLTDILVEV